MNDIINLKGRVFIVTGAGSGIGRETSIVLSQQGARLVILDINVLGLNDTLSFLHSDGHIIKICNLTEFDSFSTLVNDIIEEVGSIDGFVHCAGLSSRKKEGGSIVVMSSISSIKGYKAKTEYCVSKAAVDAFVRCMAQELAPKRIRINSIMPAEVNTPMAAKARELNLALGQIPEELPLGVTEPREVANTIAFLLSDATQTITGTSIKMGGILF